VYNVTIAEHTVAPLQNSDITRKILTVDVF
jgi:hypothetical protein